MSSPRSSQPARGGVRASSAGAPHQSEAALMSGSGNSYNKHMIPL